MINKEMEEMLNEQFNKEVYSANMYLSICSWFMNENLDGFANYFRIQAQEETLHAMKQFDYVHQVDGRIRMKAVDAPPVDFQNIKQIFELTLSHEQLVTQSIYRIVEAALANKDFATHNFFQWFISEQVEEESSVKTLLKKIEMIGDNTSALYLMNDELMQRKFVPDATA